MKKIKIIIISMLLLIPMLVKADSGSPMLTEYEVRISNPSGAEVYEYNSQTKKIIKTNQTLKYDDLYIVYREQIINNELYCEIYESSKQNEKFESSYLVKLSNLKPLDIKLNEYKKEDSVKYYIFGGGTYLYKGPSKIYEKITPQVSIKAGTIVETNYYDELWAYIEYNGVKGWIYTYGITEYSPYQESANVTELIEETMSIKTTASVNLYDTPKTDKVLTTIKENTVLSNLKVLSVYFEETKKSNYYIEYNGIKGWLKNTVPAKFAFKKENENLKVVVNPQGIKLYKNPNDEKNIITTIPYQTELTSNYEYYKDNSNFYSEFWEEVTYNNETAWIKISSFSNDKNYASKINKEMVITNLEGIKLYEFIDNKTSISTIPYNTPLTATLYTYTTDGTWYFVEYEEQQGWIYLDDSNHNNSSSSSNLPNANPSSGLESSSNELNSSSSPSQKILVYMVTVIVLSLTAFVTIILINKSKKDQNATK